MLIASRANEHIKRTRLLMQGKGRRESGLHMIEGEKLLEEATKSGMEVVDVFVREGQAISYPYDACVHQVTESVMDALSDLVTPPGVIATIRTPSLTPPAVYPKGLIVALDRLQDPGNVGTIIRTADAMGIAGILLSADTADPYAPKTIRAAMGSTYHIPIWSGRLLDELTRLKEAGAVMIAGHLAGEETIPTLGETSVLVIGNEGAGISKEVANLCTKVRLPMRGRAESLNASVAAGIFLFEMSKQL